ncbi:hypothetical protein V6N12_034317 [Hibiscus sabdariffa]|uniref:Uncharacterized protein n=1 Tax=Hibiscus sabdariffa TaxID=183260 RepID=A0ABR2A1Z4_9ROSI
MLSQMSELKDCGVQSKTEELMDPNKQPDTTPSPEVLKATTCAIEAVHVSFTHAASRDNAPFVPIHHVPNQDNTPFVLVHPVPGQDNDPSIPIDHVPNQNSAQRSRKRQSRSAMPTESIVNWVVSKKQGLNERFDKVSRYETFGIHPHRPKKTKFIQEQTQTLESLLALPWKDKAADQEVKDFIKESFKKCTRLMH